MSIPPAQWPRMTSTRDRILDTALALFNRHGERRVTTNHIAAELGISPGNLYYHFRNKTDIVFELFQRYEGAVAAFLQVPPDRPLTWQDKVAYLEAILRNMWETRFFHRELGHLLDADERLRERYAAFARQSLDQGMRVYRALRGAGLIEADDEALEALLVNTWILVANWTGFVHALVPGDQLDEALDRTLLRQGIYQILCLEAPYLRGEARSHLREMKDHYRHGDHSTLELLFRPAATTESTHAG